MQTREKPKASSNPRARELLATELGVFKRRRAELAAQATGKWVLIRGEEVAGFFETSTEAAHAGWERYGAVPFLVKKVNLANEPLFYPTLHADV